MAANQQLKDYIDQQVKLGVSKDAIKVALLGAGWQESDVLEAIGGGTVSAPAAAAQFKTPEIMKPVEVKPIETKPIEVKPVEITPMAKPSIPSSMPSSKPFIASDIFQPKKEPMFQPRGNADQKSFSSDKPQIVSLSPSKNGTGFLGEIKRFALPETIGLIAIAAIGAAVFFYMRNANIETKLAAANQGSSASQTLVASLTSDKANLTDQIASLSQTIDDLQNQLVIFALPQAGSSSTKEIAIKIKGTLRGGGKLSYDIVTDKNIVVSIKNSKDSNVDATLKPLFGNIIEVTGTHSDADYGRSLITVTAVNGAPLVSPQPSPASTSTPKTATSTGKGASTSTTP